MNKTVKTINGLVHQNTQNKIYEKAHTRVFFIMGKNLLILLIIIIGMKVKWLAFNVPYLEQH